MAKKKQSVPEYGTVTRKGTLYYRTRITDADGKQVSLYATTCEELYEKQLEARRQVNEIIFHRKHPTVAEYCEKWLLILIKGLEDDTYTMTEVRTDNGYVLLKQDIEVMISQKESTENCTIYASDALGLIQNDPRYAQIIQSDANLRNIPQKHLEHKLLTASATVSGKKVNMVEDNGSTNAEAPLTVVNTRGFDLPKTGDNGTMMFTIVGILLMVGAAVVLYAVSSKKSA